ncbi:MAG: hypothetical protein M3Y04_09425, partial [Actinomycetota bacterium]|nr:hypothetical protein [Actinomycetota bacterium]
LQVLVPHYTPMAGVAVEGSGARSATTPALAPKAAATARGAGEAGDLSLEVYDVERAAGFLVLRFGLHNLGTKSFLAGDRFQAPELHLPRVHDASGVTLSDQTLILQPTVREVSIPTQRVQQRR